VQSCLYRLCVHMLSGIIVMPPQLHIKIVMIVIKHHLNPGVYGASKVHEGGRPASTPMSHCQSCWSSSTSHLHNQEDRRVTTATMPLVSNNHDVDNDQSWWQCSLSLKGGCSRCLHLQWWRTTGVCRVMHVVVVHVMLQHTKLWPFKVACGVRNGFHSTLVSRNLR